MMKPLLPVSSHTIGPRRSIVWLVNFHRQQFSRVSGNHLAHPFLSENLSLEKQEWDMVQNTRGRGSGMRIDENTKEWLLSSILHVWLLCGMWN